MVLVARHGGHVSRDGVRDKRLSSVATTTKGDINMGDAAIAPRGGRLKFSLSKTVCLLVYGQSSHIPKH